MKNRWVGCCYSKISRNLVQASELLCEAVDLRPGCFVLDVGTGNGNTAISAARRDCQVIAFDSSLKLLRLAKQRAKAEHLKVHLQKGYMEKMPFSSNAFDVVLSTFATSFSTNQKKTARELVRVCRRGGMIALTNWLESPVERIFDEVVEQFELFNQKNISEENYWVSKSGLKILFKNNVKFISIKKRIILYYFMNLEEYIAAVCGIGEQKVAIQKLTKRKQLLLYKTLFKKFKLFFKESSNGYRIPHSYLEVIGIKK